MVSHILTSSYIIFINNILDVCISCILFNATYSISNFYRAILQCDCDIGLTLRYLKSPYIWRPVF